MSTALSAELFALRKRPATRVIGLVWTAQILLFGLAVPYIVYLVMSGSDSPETVAAGNAALANILPDRFVAGALTSFPLFGSAITMVLGAVVMGGEFRWNTLGLLLSQRPGRAQVVLARVAGLSVVVLGLVVAAFALSAAAGLLIALVEDRPMHWPGLGTVLAGVGGCWLIGTACATVGLFLAVVFRSVGSALAVGLIWLFPVEMLVNGLTFALPGLKALQAVLITPNAGSLATALGANTPSGGGPFILTSITGGGPSALVLALYVVVFTGLAAFLVRRRDIP